MKQALLSCGLGVTLLAGAAPAIAQDQPPEAPAKVLQIIREEIKSGRATAHEKFESGYVKAYRNAKRAPYLAMSTLTGPSEAWYIVSFPSYEALETESDAIAKDTTLSAELERLDEVDSAFRTGGRTMVAEYKPELSYRARGDISGVHYVEVTIIRVRPGHNREYQDLATLSKKAHEQANVDEHFAVYEIESGMPIGTYIVFAGLNSLAQLDTDTHTQAYRDAVGDEGRARMQKLIADSLISADRMVFQFSPRMSNPPAWLAKGDPEFWSVPKPVMRPALPKPSAKPTP
jgi:hypothetical protein